MPAKPHGNATLDALQAKHPEKIRDWYKDSDGYWVTLKSGWSRWGEVHSVTELTVREVVAAMREVEPCDCDDCKRMDRL